MKKLLTLFVSACFAAVSFAQTASPATNITSADAGDYNGSADLGYSFDTAAVQNTVSEYRVMIVKESQVIAFNIAAAQAVSATNYVAYTSPQADNVSNLLPAGFNDVTGTPIELDTAYRVFVLTVADGANALVDTLTSATTPVTLTDPALPTASPATNITSADVGDYNGSADLEYSFDTAAVQSTVSEYRVMIVKESQVIAFNIAAAQAVSATNYVAYTSPQADNVSNLLPAGFNDVTGTPIELDTAYRVFVLTVANPANASSDTLTSATVPVTLTDPLLPTLPYGEDFSTVTIPALPAGYTTQTSGSDAGFVTLNATPGGFYGLTPISGNYAITNDDDCNCDKSADYLFMPGPFDFSTPQDYQMSFDYELNNAYDGVAEVQVSTDTGATWSTLAVLPATSSVDGTWTWANRSINLSAYSNTAGVMFRFLYDDEGSWAFGLAIDNIVIDSLPAIDVALGNGNIDTRYTLTPSSQIRPVDVSVEYTNNGAAPLTNVIITASESNTGYSSSETVASIAPGANGTVTFADQFWADAGEGSYDVTFTATVAGDANTANNTTASTLEVSDSLYQLANSISFFYTDDARYVNIYEVNQRDTLLAIWTTLYNGTNSPLTPGDTVFGGIYELDQNGDPFVEIGTTDTFIIPATVTGTLVPVKLNFPADFRVEAGSYGIYVDLGLNALGQQDASRYVARTGFLGQPGPGGDYVWLASEDAYGEGTYWWVDAMFSSNRAATLDPDDPIVVDGVIEAFNNGEWYVYPNPANGVFHIGNLTGASTVTVLDITGKAVKTMNLTGAQSQVTVDVSDMVGGLYIVKVDGEAGTSSKKVLVK